MNNINDMLRQMGGGLKGNQCSLATYDFNETWTLTLTLKDGSNHLLISGKGNEPGEAVEDAYKQWERMTRALPEFNKALPPPPTPMYDSQDGDQYASPERPNGLDDNMPF